MARIPSRCQVKTVEPTAAQLMNKLELFITSVA